MRFYFAISLIALCGLYQEATAQKTINIQGTLVDCNDNSPLTGAHIIVVGSDSSKHATVVDNHGKFSFDKIPKQSYKLYSSFLGYQKIKEQIEPESAKISLNPFKVCPVKNKIDEVTVTEKVPTSVLKGDTLEFNALAFKTAPDAAAEDMVEKLPGIIISDDKIEAQGEEVKRVLVDNKPFFGNDPSIALKNIPAEVIDKIQVFDKLSDQSEFTGFNDGNEEKTINIITKPTMRNGTFGKFFAGYGSEDRYLLGGNVNLFNNEQRISIVGLSNNVNQQNFTNEDLLGVMSSASSGRGNGRGRRGGKGKSLRKPGGSQNAENFLVGKQSGTSNTHSFGINYTDSWGEKIEVTGSYFTNYSENNSFIKTNRSYFQQNENQQVYLEDYDAGSTNINHRLNLRLTYNINKYNSIIFTPNISLQNNKSNSFTNGLNTDSVNYFNSTEVFSNSDREGYNLGGNLLFRHRFDKKGRTFSVNLGSSANSKDRPQTRESFNNYQEGNEFKQDSAFQKIFSNTNENQYSANLMYTEPVGQNGSILLAYKSKFKSGNSNKETFDYNFSNQSYDILDSVLTNKFEDEELLRSAEASYRYKKEKFYLSGSLEYEQNRLSSTPVFPLETEQSNTYNTLLPRVHFNWKPSQGNNIRIFYRTRSSQPNTEQLHNSIDDSNPLMLSTGNPLLKQAYSQMLITKWSRVNPQKSQTFFLLLYASKTNNYISNTTFFATRDTLLSNGILLNQGTQLSYPVNLDGYFQLRTLVSYGFPLKKIKSNLNLNLGVNYNQTPAIIDGFKSTTTNYAINPDIILSSNISDKTDFTLSYSGRFNLADNNLRNDYDQQYYTQRTKLRFHWLAFNNYSINTQLNHKIYYGLSENYNQSILLWNLSVGRKIFKNKRGELRFTATDILNQNTNISRNITESYIEDIESNEIGRYFMFSFIYNLREWKGSSQNDKFRNKNFEPTDRPGRPPFEP